MDEGTRIVAELMKVAATTAPKAMGQDFIEVKIAAEMIRTGQEKGAKNWDRDAGTINGSSGLVLIGVLEHQGLVLDCGACGYATCEEFNSANGVEDDFKGPNCMLRLLDLGIALGSAVKTAQIHNVDNRIMYRVGVAARRLGLMESDVVMGIPLSVGGKNVYFDR